MMYILYKKLYVPTMELSIYCKLLQCLCYVIRTKLFINRVLNLATLYKLSFKLVLVCNRLSDRKECDF